MEQPDGLAGLSISRSCAERAEQAEAEVHCTGNSSFRRHTLGLGWKSTSHPLRGKRQNKAIITAALKCYSTIKK